MAGFTFCGFLLLLCGSMCLSMADNVPDSNVEVQEKMADANPLTGNVRAERQAGVCDFPAGDPKTARWNCTKYARKIKCQENCVWGYTLPTGPSKKFKCYFKENVWVPSSFEECKPFVNCRLKLKSPGTINCTTHQDNKEDVCTIMCYPYDEFREIAPTPYTCSIDSNWAPPLPFCVEQDPNFETVPNPLRY